MKRALLKTLPLSLPLLISGCMSGTVDIRQVSPASQAPAASSSSRSHTDSSDSSATPADANLLFFSTERSGALGSPAGLNFVSVKAESPAPFGFYFEGWPSVSVLYWSPVLIHGREEVAWIEQSGTHTSLQSMNTSSMQQGPGAQVPAASAYALLTDESALAGISTGDSPSQSSLFVQSLGSGALVKGPETAWEADASVQWLSSGQLAVIEPQARKIHVFAGSDLSKPEMILSGQALTMSVSGKTLVLFTGSAIQKIDPATGKTLSSFNLSLGAFEHPRWNGESELAFVNSRDGNPEIAILDLAQGRIVGRLPVSAPPEQIHSICPAWADGKLYFAGQSDQGYWSIWQTTADGGSPNLVASPNDPTLRYVCPQGVTQ